MIKAALYDALNVPSEIINKSNRIAYFLRRQVRMIAERKILSDQLSLNPSIIEERKLWDIKNMPILHRVIAEYSQAKAFALRRIYNSKLEWNVERSDWVWTVKGESDIPPWAHVNSKNHWIGERVVWPHGLNLENNGAMASFIYGLEGLLMEENPKVDMFLLNDLQSNIDEVKRDCRNSTYWDWLI